MNITIAGKKIGIDQYPYVVAELSANHNGSLQTALKLLDAAKEAGADAVKLQTYTPDTITLNHDGEEFKIKEGLWSGRTLYDLYEQAHLPWEWHYHIFEHAKNIGITVFSSPFDQTSVDFLVELEVPAFKIASFEVVDLPLIRYVATKGKPMIISTGMADEYEIEAAVHVAREGGCKELALLHCVSGYPASPEEYNLRTIPDLMSRYGVLTGLSDHTLDNTTAISSISLGATIIEKHFTLDRTGGGPDDIFSLEPQELRSLCNDTKIAWKALGKIDYGTKSSEKGNIQFRRSLYFVDDMRAGDVITERNIRSVRPGFGLLPKYFDEIIGKTVVRDIKKFEPVRLEDINENHSETE
ncbi:pseudaminic acid synthase [Planktomarina temperata]|nr:pseudaminic acid synthase [Planktomarina temperata]